MNENLKKDFNKQREEAINTIVRLLNENELTIVSEHNIRIVPIEAIQKG